jgi:hypothetical protein
VVLGVVGDRTYAFVGLERIGGVMVYDVTDPTAPTFVQYVNNRDFTQPVSSTAAKDLAPDGMAFISAHDSPTRSPLLVVANEVSGTTTIFAITNAPVAARAALAPAVDNGIDDDVEAAVAAAVARDFAQTHATIARADVQSTGHQESIRGGQRSNFAIRLRSLFDESRRVRFESRARATLVDRVVERHLDDLLLAEFDSELNNIVVV